MFDNINNVIHRSGMLTNTRNFLRDFAAFKTKARRGETVRIQDKEGEFLFTLAAPRKSLLGIAKGKMSIVGNLARPTLADAEWRPSL